jgi:hypothetical protein
MSVWIAWDKFSSNRPVTRFTMPGNGDHDIVTDYLTFHNFLVLGWKASRQLGGEGVQFPITEDSKYWPNDTEAGQTLNEVQLILVFLSHHWGLKKEHYTEFQLYGQKVQNFLIRCQGVEEEDKVLEALLSANRPFEESDLA